MEDADGQWDLTMEPGHVTPGFCSYGFGRRSHWDLTMDIAEPSGLFGPQPATMYSSVLMV